MTYPIFLEGETWTSINHYVYAMKFIVDNPKYAERIRNSSDPIQLGDEKRWVRMDWEKVQDEVMFNAIYAMFTQHKKLEQLLLTTKANLIPILMKVRNSLENRYPIRPIRETYENYARDKDGMLIIEFV